MHILQQQILEIYKSNGSKLPPFRQLAKELNVASLNTVSYHVNQLKKSGAFGIGNQPNGIINFNIKNLLDFENKSGVYVLMKNKKPFYIGSNENIKNDIIEILQTNSISPISPISPIGPISPINPIISKSSILDEIKSDPEKITIAYYITENPLDREELKNHLINFYSEQKIKLLDS